MPALQDPQLAEVIAKIYVIGKRDFKGKIYDNVISIFDSLDIEDQKTLIRGILGLYVASTTSLIYEKEVIDSGDVDGLIAYLREIGSKLRRPAPPDILGLKPPEPVPAPVAGPPAPATPAAPPAPAAVPVVTALTPEAQMVATLTSLIKYFSVGIMFLVLAHMTYMAVSSDPDALEGARIYKQIYDALLIFLK